MMRKMLIAAAAAAAVIAGSTIDASARMGGGHGGFGRMGGFSHGGFARMGGFSHGGFARVGGFSHGGRFAAVHPRAFPVNRFAFRHHRFFNRRFVSFAAFGAYPYGAYNSCYERVWTPRGWRWTYVCGDDYY